MPTLKVPVKGGEFKEVQGQTFILKVGDEKIKVFYHDSISHVNCKTITHYESGLRITDVTTIDHIINKDKTTKQLCQHLMDKLVSRYGLDRVLSIIKNRQPINNK